MEIQYIGEHLFPGSLGRFSVWVGFLAALTATILYFIAFRYEGRKIRFTNWARVFYSLHTLALTTVAVVLYYLIINHYFEYSYVWQYSSKELRMEYIISCFWAGQEGSFLFWALSQAIVGLVLLKLSRHWEAPVMAIFSLAQAFIMTMLLGIHIGGHAIGSSPFTLLRDSVGSIQDTIFTMPDYLGMIPDGNGLNPLLENIWMTIHPPVLFIGYALALVPFSYAIASLLKRDYTGWISRAMPWTLIALFTLGAGILLGGAWAYVSLTFGGFWAWDPVENASLVPWMTLLAGLHFMIISRKQNLASAAAYLMITLTYVLVLYASFLTRSGVLADTSAHSFGDSGMSGQLLIFLLVFLILSIGLVSFRFRAIHQPRPDVLLSREFWIFMGSVIVVLAAFQIIFTTSIPVINGLFGLNLAPPNDVIAFYNRWQTPFAMLIAGFIAFTQFLGYGDNTSGRFLRRSLYSLMSALVLTIPLVLTGVVRDLNYILLVLFILFALCASLFSLLRQTSKPRNTPAVITHIGFILLILGAVVTFSNSTVISRNTSAFDLGDRRSNEENLILMRNDTLTMSGYKVTYCGHHAEGNTTFYQVEFLKEINGQLTHAFTLYPSVNVHPKMGAVYNPATRHFLMVDFYTYIATVSKEPDYIVIKAIRNPYINILWLGSVLMLIGFILAFFRRSRARMRLRG